MAAVHAVVVAQGRNRIWDEPAPGQIGRTRLAHAEVNAILALSAESFDPRALTLFTTAEPCPLCVGAILMANIRALRYASREPFAGSVAMLRATPYVRSKEVSVHGPNDSQLEGFLIAIATEFHLRAAGPRVAELVALSAVVRPDAVARCVNSGGTAACAVPSDRDGVSVCWRTTSGEGQREDAIPGGRGEARPGRARPSGARPLGARAKLRCAAQEECREKALLVHRRPEHRQRRGHGRA